jgi:hypothetical protein
MYKPVQADEAGKYENYLMINRTNNYNAELRRDKHTGKSISSYDYCMAYPLGKSIQFKQLSPPRLPH